MSATARNGCLFSSQALGVGWVLERSAPISTSVQERHLTRTLNVFLDRNLLASLKPIFLPDIAAILILIILIITVIY